MSQVLYDHSTVATSEVHLTAQSVYPYRQGGRVHICFTITALCFHIELAMLLCCVFVSCLSFDPCGFQSAVYVFTINIFFCDHHIFFSLFIATPGYPSFPSFSNLTMLWCRHMHTHTHLYIFLISLLAELLHPDVS